MKRKPSSAYSAPDTVLTIPRPPVAAAAAAARCCCSGGEEVEVEEYSSGDGESDALANSGSNKSGELEACTREEFRGRNGNSCESWRTKLVAEVSRLNDSRNEYSPAPDRELLHLAC
jgi:hypothetical protein